MPGSITRAVIKGRARINAVRAGKVQMIYGASKVVSLVYYRKFCSFCMQYTPGKIFHFFESISHQQHLLYQFQQIGCYLNLYGDSFG
jgi:hypothetical protein